VRQYHPHFCNDNLIHTHQYSPRHWASTGTTVSVFNQSDVDFPLRAAPPPPPPPPPGAGVAIVGNPPWIIHPDPSPWSLPAFPFPRLSRPPAAPAIARVAFSGVGDRFERGKPAPLPSPALPAPDQYPPARSFASRSLPAPYPPLAMADNFSPGTANIVTRDFPHFGGRNRS
jgi:hypothetical protein